MYSVILDSINDDNNRLLSSITINVAAGHSLNNYLPVYNSRILLSIINLALMI